MARGPYVWLVAIAVAAACSKSEPAGTGGGATEPPAIGRRVAIEVQRTGYVPNTIAAAPGEKLVLVFTRTADTECGRYITVQGTDIEKELPMNQPVEVPVAAPASGELVFACGMDMMHGLVTTTPANP